MAHDLRVDQAAKKYGSAGLPAPDQSIADGQERKIRQEIVRRVEDAKRKALKEEKALRAAIKSRQLAPDVMRSNEIPQNCEQELERRERRLAAEEADLRARLDDLQNEVDEYRSEYGITRRPRLSEEEDRSHLIFGLGICSLLQLAANSFLFAQGSAFGLAFGLGVALIVATFDISLHFSLGRVGARIEAPDLANRLLGGLASLFSAFTVLVLNLGTVHLRLISRAAEGTTADWDQWLPSLLSTPFGFGDFVSWTLFGLGLLCSGLAIVSGWLWDDPIPVFRKNGRLIARLQEDLRDVKEERSGLSEHVVSAYEEKLDSLDEKAESHVSIISDSVNRIQQLVADYSSYCATARETYAALISRYRDQNRIHRDGIDVPEFFHHSPKIELSAQLPISLEELDKVETRERQLYDQLKENLRASRVSLHELRRNRSVNREDDETA